MENSSGRCKTKLVRGLFVDDCDMQRDMARDMVKAIFGNEILLHIAESAREALEELDKSRFTFVISDRNMEKPNSGLLVVREAVKMGVEIVCLSTCEPIHIEDPKVRVIDKMRMENWKELKRVLEKNA